MKILRISDQRIPSLPASACAIGYFDGLHKGHQQLIQAALCTASQQNIACAVLTFDPDPWAVIRPDAPLSHLTDLSDKAALLEKMGVDLFYIIDFSRRFAALSIDAFHDFLAAMNIRDLVCGFDFTYGFKGSGNADSLKRETRFETEVISSVDEDEQKISSTRLEALLEQGNVEKAGELCGFYYSLKGEIVHGYKRGRQMGFPTANLKVSQEAIAPAAGVYAGYVQYGLSVSPAMINVGSNPTFGNSAMSIEACLLGVHVNLYGQHARFFFVSRLRKEMKFSSMEQLSAQLSADEAAVLPALKSHAALLAPTAKLWSLDALNAILKA